MTDSQSRCLFRTFHHCRKRVYNASSKKINLNLGVKLRGFKISEIRLNLSNFNAVHKFIQIVSLEALGGYHSADLALGLQGIQKALHPFADIPQHQLDVSCSVSMCESIPMTSKLSDI